MKKIFFVLFFILSFVANSQQNGTITVNWNEKKDFKIGENSISIPQFDGDNFNFNGDKKELFYIKKLGQSAAIDENSIEITNIVYETVPESYLGDLSKNTLPKSINATIKNCIGRDINTPVLQFYPIIKVENEYKKVLSFSYHYNLASGFNKNQLTNNVATVTNSVLSSGSWHRFYIQQSGVYKLSKSFLSSIGVDVNSDPRKIKIYGNGGRMLPLKNSDYYPDDLAENAIQFIGESDGSFNDNDYILFYAEGVDQWSAENNTHNNLYADQSYYYVTTGGNDGKRMTQLAEPAGASTLTLTKFDDFQIHEVDLTNMAKIGRTWFGEDFSLKNEQDFTFNFPNIDTTSPTKITVHVGSSSYAATNFEISTNGVSNGTINLNPNLFDFSYSSFGASVVSTQNFTVHLKYNNMGVPTAKGFLDYIIVEPKSNLSGYGKQFPFTYKNANSSSGIAQYQFSNATSISQVWDITDIYNVTSIANSNQSNFSFKANLGTTKKYVAIDESDLYSPPTQSNTSVSNQNLKGTIFINSQGNFQDVDYLIITNNSLASEAEKLAAFHRNYYNYNVKVVTLDKIYQEFGGGKQDIGAIRNFVKYVYQNASTPANKVKYLNLYGNASFDYKNRIPNNHNIVPIFEAVDSYVYTDGSFSSDDYFAMMDANEGDIELNFGGPDIAVGRMIVSSTQQAAEMNNKVFEYYDIKSYGNWRNNYVCIADDSDRAGDSIFQTMQNNLTDLLYTQKPIVNFKKILLDAYQQQTTAGGDRYPQAKSDLQYAFDKGSLVFNYLGHGGEAGLTGERIWDKNDGSNLTNQYKYPLFITITCEFSRFDNPYNPTAGEYIYWNPKGGAISMVTTTREIYYSSMDFNNVLTQNLYGFVNSSDISIAEAMRVSKATSNYLSAQRVVSYIGDPAVRLAIPKPKVVLTKVNDVSISQPVDDLKALSYVKLSGQVQDENGNLLNSYNGELFVNVFDKNYTRSTLNNDGFDPIMSFNNLGETIFRGNASVTNGLFEFGFVVPRDIKIPLGNGRISFYAKRNQILLDKTGYNLDIKVGGINTNAVADVTPPKVRLYMNDETFVNGGITNQSPYFLAYLYDEHGINTASGIGHDIVAILDGNESNPYILNDYYETELNDYTHGKIRYPFKNLALGLHTITFKAWDVYNNFVSAEIQFIVVGDGSISLTNVLNYPNPFVNYTQFWFTHNKPYENLEVQVQIMTITGKLVKTINQNVTTEGFLSREISWDGKDDFGDKIGKGVYVYKLTVKSTLSGEKAEKIEKLVIL